MTLFSLTHEELEVRADMSKMVTVQALAEEGYLTEKEADLWCENNTIIIREKSIFRTISNLWNKRKESNKTHHYLVVSKERHKRK